MLLQLGAHGFDLTHRAVVMGVLVPDGTDGPVDPELLVDRSPNLAGELVAAGAQIVDLGYYCEGLRIREQGEVTARVVAAVREAVDVPVAFHAGDAAAIEAGLEAGGALVETPSGFGDLESLGICGDAHAAVVLRDKIGAGQLGASALVKRLADRAAAAELAGVDRGSILLDPGDVPTISTSGPDDVLSNLSGFADLGYPVVVSLPDRAPGKDDEIAGIAAAAVVFGCRVLRAHDVRTARRVAYVIGELLSTRARTR